MASPATSPPYPTHIPLSNPKKRPSLNTSHGPSKRRRPASLASGASSAHPLRQTSFPPEESAIDDGRRSPSVDSDITGVTGGRSVVTAGTGKKKKGKGKKREKLGVAGSVRSGGSKGQKEREASEVLEEEEDEEEDLGLDGLAGEGEQVDKAAEKKNLAVLVDAFNDSQLDRYETFRRVKLKKETVRKIANQTLSQSVPPTVITTINGYTKTFIGTLIERARDVQTQWASIETPPPTPHRQQQQIPIDPTDFLRQENPSNEFAATSMTGTTEMMMVDPADLFLGGNDRRRRERTDLGPLLPDHFREAIRRYKRDGEAGGTGMAGGSVGLGLQGTVSARLQGRRLFK